MKVKLLLLLLTMTLIGTNTSVIEQMDIPFVSDIVSYNDNVEKLKELDERVNKINEEADKKYGKQDDKVREYNKGAFYEDINFYLNVKESLRGYKAYLLGADEEFLYKNTVGIVTEYLIAFNFPRFQKDLEYPFTNEQINRAVDFYSSAYKEDIMDLDNNVKRGLKILKVLESESKDGFIDYRLRKKALGKIKNMPDITLPPTENQDTQNKTKEVENESDWMMNNFIYYILIGGVGILLIVNKLIQYRRYAED